MSLDQSKSLLQQMSKDHYDQKETPEDYPETPCEGYQTDSSMSPSIPFISAAQSPSSYLPPPQQSPTPTPSVSDWQDAQSDITTGKEKDEDMDVDLARKYPLMTFGLTKRRLSRGQSGSQGSRKVADLEDIEFPSLDYGPHLRLFQEEDGETPGENDLFPSTPLDEDQLPHADSKFKEELGSVVINEIEDNPELQWSDIGWLDPRWLDPRWLDPLMSNAAENAEVFAMNVWQKFQSWKVVGYSNLPQFLQDNDFLRKGHRPPLPNLAECFKSIFRIHTETGNIWTHLLGSVAFIGLSIFFMTRSSLEIDHHEKAVFMVFFAGAIVCMGFSFTYHTVNCHQNKFIGQLFVKFDYCGIAFLTVGSFVPWLYYSFYCNYTPKVVYMSITSLLGVMAVIVSLWDKFGTPRYRPYRACVFIVFGLSGIAPATHYAIQNGWEKSINEAAMGWLVFMGFLYITGTLLYAFRIPERFFPGKVDILFHSHQIFHCFVIAGAFVHYHGISNMALYRLQIGECPLPPVDLSHFA